MKIFLAFFSVLNVRPWSSVNLSRPCIPLVAQPFEILVALSQITTLDTSRQDDDMFYKARHSCLRFIEGLIYFFGWLQLLPSDPSYFEKSQLILSLLRSLIVDLFPVVTIRLERRTCWFVGRNLIVFVIQAWFSLLNLRLLNSSLDDFFDDSFFLEFALLCLVEFLSCKQSSGWISTQW